MAPILRTVNQHSTLVPSSPYARRALDNVILSRVFCMSYVGDSPQAREPCVLPSHTRIYSLGGKECENGQYFSIGSKTLLGLDRRWNAIAQWAFNRYRLGHTSVPNFPLLGAQCSVEPP